MSCETGFSAYEYELSYLVFTQLVSAGLGFYRNNKILSPIYQMNRAITPYRNLFQLLEQESFDSPYLNDLQQTLLKNGSASAALKELETITDSVCARHNIYAFLLYNGLFLYDYHCVEQYEKWKETYKYSLKNWLKAVGNTIDLTYGTCIITGSNMSGKTTFIRSIGINVVLAYAGGFCTASSLRLSLMELYTSIRTEDNVNESISTFYAEMLRIKKMIEANGDASVLLCGSCRSSINLADHIHYFPQNVHFTAFWYPVF